MSKSWKCAICGATMISKCPDQRTIFPSLKEGIIGSLLSIQRVDDIRGNNCELFLNYTSSRKHTTGQAIKSMIELISDPPEYLDNLGCEHIWVLNSTSETTCSMGCTHANLNDVERLRTEYANETKPAQTVKSLTSEYATVIASVLEQARIAVNVTKPTYDLPVEQDFAHIKHATRVMLNKIGDGKRVQKPYRVRIAGATWRDPSNYVYFNSFEDAQRYVIGTKLTTLETTIEIEKLDENQEQYRICDKSIELDYACCVCGQHANDLFVIMPTGETAHQKCYKKLLDSPKNKMRTGKTDIPAKTSWTMEETLKEIFNLATCRIVYKRNGTAFIRFTKKCTAEELSILTQRIINYLD